MQRNIIFIIIIALTIAVLSLAGCGGGDGGSSPAGASTTVSKGVVTAVGSIVVNGLTYNIDNAAIKLDGLPGSASALQPGMVVTVKGVFDNRTSHTFQRTATSVEFADSLEGPVDYVNTFSPSLLVMGQPVLITTGTPPNKTVFVGFDNLSSLKPQIDTVQDPPALTGLSIVEVSGFPNGINGFQATRIVRKGLQAVAPTSPLPIEIKGAISALDQAGGTFNIGALAVDYSAVNPIFLPNPLRNGLFVEVQGLLSDYTTGSAPTLLAAVVKTVKEGITADEGSHVAVEGFVSGLAGNSFTIEGTSVDAGALSLAEVANAVKVRVEGIFSNGVVKASKITLL